MKDYDNPDTEEAWCNEQHIIAKDYLQSQGLNHGRIGEWPAWHIAPYVSVWAIESNTQPESIGWWVISGDLPTDYISASDCVPPQHPRKAIRVFASRWLEVINAWRVGQEYENFNIKGNSSKDELAPLLSARAQLLIKWADDESLWSAV